MRGLYNTGGRINRERLREKRVKDERRICRGVKSFFVLDALETADIATIRPSFRGKETKSEREQRKDREFRSLGIQI